MSVMSETLGFSETCGRSHEFLRRACTYTPTAVSWAGDLMVINGAMLKQSEVEDFRGDDTAVEYVFDEIDGTPCGGDTISLPDGHAVEETDIRTGGASTFAYAVPKNPDRDQETRWSLDMLMSNNDCGVMRDGGDVLQEKSEARRVMSICGSIDRSSGLFDAQAHYLDNRKSYEGDPDNGLLVCIMTGAARELEVRYAPLGRDLSSGLIMSDDITVEFTKALSALGMTHQDVFEFGMI